MIARLIGIVIATLVVAFLFAAPELMEKKKER